MSTEIDNILHILARDQKIWLKMSSDISRNSRIDSQDLLHDFYITLYSKIHNGKVKISDIMYNDSLNKSFVYKMMNNIFIDSIRKNKDVYIDKELHNLLRADNSPYIDKEQIVDDILSDLHWFDRKLFNLYRKKFHSIRKLSDATDISHVVVWRTINNVIKQIKKKINEK